MICGIVDIGSNTIRLSVYKCEGGENRLLMHRKTMAGIASYIKSGRLPSEGVRIICKTLTEYKRLLDNLDIRGMHVFATAPLRNISNTEEVVASILDETGIPVNVISGEEEAVLSFTGATLGITHKKGVMIDLGGGSTEILRYEDGKILSTYSLPIGSLNLFNRYVKGFYPTEDERKAIKKAVEEQLERANVDLSPAAHICGVGGTVRAASQAANHFFCRSDDYNIISVEELKMLLKRIRKQDSDNVHELLKIVPDRIHTIIPGLIVLETVSKALNAEEITVSMCGVREGYLMKNVIGETPQSAVG
ncbi:MAG: phosphatase [Oscillospiraceae bacterium]|nr:phosphatase [Oscillospiraceae bacterium]